MTWLPRPLRELVRERARGRCEYCGKPDGIGDYPHHVDHIIALKHGGATIADNLAWACFQCNVAKGTDIATIDDETGVVTRLFNPRTQTWDEHFVVDEAMRMTGLTVVGRATIKLFNMNEPDEVEARLRLVRDGLW